MPLTDTVKQAIGHQLDALRPVLDGACRPNGLRIAVWLLPDGTLREIETTPVFKKTGERR